MQRSFQCPKCGREAMAVQSYEPLPEQLQGLTPIFQGTVLPHDCELDHQRVIMTGQAGVEIPDLGQLAKRATAARAAARAAAAALCGPALLCGWGSFGRGPTQRSLGPESHRRFPVPKRR